MGVRRRLTEADREEIPRGIAERVQGRVIAERIGRDPSVVCRGLLTEALTADPWPLAPVTVSTASWGTKAIRE